MTDAPTQPPVRRTERRHRAAHGPGLFVTDGELIERLGVPPDVARPVIAEMDRKRDVYGFPQKDALWGDRRYWPAVEQWLEARNGLKMAAPRTRRAS